uniref:Very-long-chain (3R)-3-hydroxyacyl-CoA dehydratase n=1 Tax=Acrobeloides nanus TaxID=290746 RepID=A0A914CQG3_9BILA
MFLAHFYVLMVLAYGYTTKRSAYFTHFWEEQHLSFFVCTGLQYMDVLHGMTGMTKSGYKTGLIQVTGRLTALFIIHKNPEIHAVASTFCLMFVYFMIEIFRYPYYSLSSLQIESKPITWLRYNMWIPLYPTGLFLESVTMFRSIPYYYHSEKLGFAMPNIINMSFNFGVFLALFLVTAFPYISYLLLSHMHRQRAKKINDAEKKRE